MLSFRDALEGLFRFILITIERVLKGLLYFIASPSAASIYVMRSRVSGDVDHRIICLALIGLGLISLLFATNVYSSHDFRDIASRAQAGLENLLLSFAIYAGFFLTSSAIPQRLLGNRYYRTELTRKLIFSFLSISFCAFSLLYYFLTPIFDPSIDVLYLSIEFDHLSTFIFVIGILNLIFIFYLTVFLTQIKISSSANIKKSFAVTALIFSSFSLILFEVSKFLLYDDYGSDIFEEMVLSDFSANELCIITISGDGVVVSLLLMNPSYKYARFQANGFGVYTKSFSPLSPQPNLWTFSFSADEIAKSGGAIMRPNETRLITKAIPKTEIKNWPNFLGNSCRPIQLG